MKKLRLKALELGATEILTRQQLKSILGGCNTTFDCPQGVVCNYGTCGGSTTPPSGSGAGSTGLLGETCSSGYVPCGTHGCVIIGYCH